jgi:hypothetical protein
MSRQNKVNPDHYTTAGRLSPDDLARERTKQRSSGMGRSGKMRPMPPWMLHPETATPAPAALHEPSERAGAPDEAPEEPMPGPRVVSSEAAERRPAPALKRSRAGQKRVSAAKSTARRAKSATRTARKTKARATTPRRTAAAKTRGAKRSVSARSRAAKSTSKARAAKRPRGASRKTGRRR